MKLHLPKSLRSAMLAVIVSACSFTLSSASLCAAESPAAEPAASGEPAASAAPVQANGSAFVATILDVLDAVLGGSSSVGSASVGMGGTSFTMAAPVQDNGTEAPAPVSSPAPDNLAPLTVPVEASSPAPVDYTVKCDYQGENLSAAPAASVSSLDLAPKAAPYVSGGASSSGSSSSPASAPAAGGGAGGAGSSSSSRPVFSSLAADASRIVVHPVGAMQDERLIWLGGENKWDNGQTASWHWTTSDTPAPFTPGSQVLFDLPKEGESGAVAKVEGQVHTTSMQIAEGKSPNKNVVTIDIEKKGDSLTVDSLFAMEYHTGNLPDKTTELIMKGEGTLDASVQDSNFNTDIHVMSGTMNIRFENLVGSGNNLYADLIAEDSAELNMYIKHTEAQSGVLFNPNTVIRGLSSINIAEKSTLQFDHYFSDYFEYGFYVTNDMTVNLGGKANFYAQDAALYADYWKLAGEGGNLDEAGEVITNDVSFSGSVYWMNSEPGQTHDISGSVHVYMNDVYYEAERAAVRIDDGSSLTFRNLYMDENYFGDKNRFYHAFQEDSGETRQKIIVEQGLYVTARGETFIGAASVEDAGTPSYQEAGSYDIQFLNSNGKNATLVLENNIMADESNKKSLTEVFYIGNTGTGFSYSGNFRGVIRLSSANDGTQDVHKNNVLVLRDYTPTDWAAIEFQNDANYSDFGVGVDCSYTYVCGVRDVKGKEVGEGNKAVIFSGSVSQEKNAVCKSDGKRRTLDVYVENAQDEYRTSAGVLSDLNLYKCGQGTQTFMGDFGEFNADIRVGNIERNPGGILNILENVTVTVEELTIARDSRLNVNKGDNGTENGEVKVNKKFLAWGGATTNGQGTASMLDADLRMLSGSILDVSAAVGSGGVDMGMKETPVEGSLGLGGALTLDVGVLLSDADWQNVWAMTIGERYDLAFNVSSLNGYSEAFGWDYNDELVGQHHIDASTIFGKNQFYQGEYFLCYSGNQAGGRGNNVGTVYLYKAAPEPTTGTLSLLALAGLAARRRRK
ncbi:MAG: hypothetical protein Q4F30_05295 [Akkermansia sp.]|nr:hypothetical protein [Akkermansia sp.]